MMHRNDVFVYKFGYWLGSSMGDLEYCRCSYQSSIIKILKESSKFNEILHFRWEFRKTVRRDGYCPQQNAGVKCV